LRSHNDGWGDGDTDTDDIPSIDGLNLRIESNTPECDESNNEVVWTGPFCE